MTGCLLDIEGLIADQTMMTEGQQQQQSAITASTPDYLAYISEKVLQQDL